MEMMLTLTQPGLYISNFRASGQDPSLFRALGQEILENLAGSHDCLTGDTVCRFPMKKTGQIYNFHLKILKGDS